MGMNRVLCRKMGKITLVSHYMKRVVSVERLKNGPTRLAPDKTLVVEPDLFWDIAQSFG